MFQVTKKPHGGSEQILGHVLSFSLDRSNQAIIQTFDSKCDIYQCTTTPGKLTKLEDIWIFETGNSTYRITKVPTYRDLKLTPNFDSFDNIWENYCYNNGSQSGFQMPSEKSDYAKFSSKGWKIHTTFQKGKEKFVAKYLYSIGLYFKVEKGWGSYFDHQKESGTTIYVGSYRDMIAISKVLEDFLGPILTTGLRYADNFPYNFPIGSNKDTGISQHISARLDINKSSFSQKYIPESGFSPRTGYTGIPILMEDIKEYNELLVLLKSNASTEIFARCKKLYDRSLQELRKDFGPEFIGI